MSAGDETIAGAAARHVPVLGRQAVDWLAVKSGGLYIDGTFGAGGYTRAILQTPGARVIGIDRDQSAVAHGAALVAEAQGRLELFQDRFSNLASIVRTTVDGIVLDLGVSSMQLDEAERGFSFRFDGPLDMRMGRDGPSAADVIARGGERDLAYIIATLGEEHRARAVARAIVKARSERAIETTGALAEIVARVVHMRDSQIHPATRTFQALRIFVNDELAELAHGLAAAERVLKPAGRLVVVSFHSLEDRIVKTFLTERSRAPAASRHEPEIVSAPPSFRVLTRKPEIADAAEIAANPRARSAKLRAAERTDAPARSAAVEDLLPRLPSLADVMRGRLMILRLLNFLVIGVLVFAAAYVYRIKFDATVQAEKLAKLRSEVRHERDEIASLRAQWGQLDNPDRIETLAKRYLQLKAIAPTQFDTLDHLPDRPPPPAEDEHADARDPIGGIIENSEDPATTGSIPAAPKPASAAPQQIGTPRPRSGAPQ